jgi:uncharacterized ion transporter superfamily protein YfcC
MKQADSSIKTGGKALLLCALSFSVVSYTKWMRWTWRLQLAILAITSVFLVVAVKIGFGPF